MSQEIQVGDVVRLNLNNAAGWLGILARDATYIVTKAYQSKQAPKHQCCHLRNRDTGEIVTGYDGESTWDCWLIKDEFLSAVHQRKGKRKHAAKV